MLFAPQRLLVVIIHRNPIKKALRLPLRISIVIVSLNGRERIAMPLDALRFCNPAPYEIIVVDNGSSDDLSEHVAAAYPEALLIRAPENLGFAGGNNLGILNATGDIILLLNDDTEPEPHWLAPLTEAFERYPRLGLAGCQLLYPGSQTIQHLGGVVHDNGLTDHSAWGESAKSDGRAIIPCDYATGAALAIRREVIAQIGLLDPGFWPIYFEELDFADRARRAGWRSAILRDSRVIHHESQTTGRMSQGFLIKYHRNRLRYLMKNRRKQWLRVLQAEARWLGRNAPWDQIWPLALAYGWAPFQFAEIAREQ